MKSVEDQIKNNNAWYVDSHFEWANQPSVKRIYEKRFLFIRNIIMREHDKKGTLTVLDYGCGDGYWSYVLSQFGFCDITGADYNPLRLERFKALMPGVKFVRADLTEKNDNPGKFDIVLCSQVVEHIPDDRAFISGIKDHLKSDGILILGTTNEGCFTQSLRRMIVRGSTDHVHFYREKEIREKLENAGFTIYQAHYEIFYPGSDFLYYRMASTGTGFKILETLAKMIKSQCSDYYFDCSLRR